MRLHSIVLCAVVALAACARAQPDQADRFLASRGIAEPPDLYRIALRGFLRAEDAYRQGRYELAAQQLRDLWAAHPPGTSEWSGLWGPAERIGADKGVNIGLPPCYYALRMLTECAEWRTTTKPGVPHAAATLTVVLVGHSEGIEPTSMAGLRAGAGRPALHDLAPELRADGSRIVHQSLWLFLEYVRAMTRGRLEVKARVLDLRDLSVQVGTSAAPLRTAGLIGSAMERIWEAVPTGVKATTDWWWVLYPSNVPERYPDFTRTEYITGGMGSGPDGSSPCFMIDDRWLVRKPPHLGHGPYTDIERRAYLPQWLQHEFYHHLFRAYPEFRLEVKGHDWFDRKTWPADFTGTMEPDYYYEALHKRLQPAMPPMQVRLRYAPPKPEMFRGIALDAVCGEYRHEPVENDWHVGTIAMEASAEGVGTPALRWTNKAGVSWRLTPDLAHGVLRTDPGSPYYSSDPVWGREFRIVLKREDLGNYVSEIAGFAFGGGFYALQHKAGSP